jgi:hypothetical protein
MSEKEALDAYEKLPLSFIPNEGQTEEEAVRYYAQGAGYGFFFSKGGATLSFADGEVTPLRPRPVSFCSTYNTKGTILLR